MAGWSNKSVEALISHGSEEEEQSRAKEIKSLYSDYQMKLPSYLQKKPISSTHIHFITLSQSVTYHFWDVTIEKTKFMKPCFQIVLYDNHCNIVERL